PAQASERVRVLTLPLLTAPDAIPVEPPAGVNGRPAPEQQRTVVPLADLDAATFPSAVTRARE
ncbi:MAG: hypothetical protein K2V38_16850, partial [Gemmataceae bacterium]|nr:hypothetical protein [Gemmataceae bacterium]